MLLYFYYWCFIKKNLKDLLPFFLMTQCNDGKISHVQRSLLLLIQPSFLNEPTFETL